MHRPLSNRADQPEAARMPERATRYIQASSQSDIEIRDLHLPAGHSLKLEIRSAADVTISGISVGGRKS